MKTVRLVTGIAVLLLSLTGGALAQDSLGMSLVSTLPFWRAVTDMEFLGNIAYVAGGTSGLHVLDVSDAAEPIELTFRDNSTHWVCVDGNRLYTTSGLGGVVYDLSDPANPQEIGRWHIGGTYLLYGEVLVRGNIGVVVDEEGCPFVLDVSDPDNVQIIDYYPFADCYQKPVGIVGDYFVFMGNFGSFRGGIKLYDLSNPHQPLQVAAIDTNYAMFDAAISGDYAYLATSSGGLRIVDLADPLQPEVIAVREDSANSPCYAVTVTDSHAVVAKEWGLDIWNVADPSNPVFEGALSTSIQSWELYAKDSYVYAPTGYLAGTVMTIADISDPANPTEIGHVGDLASLVHLTISGTKAYVADRYNGLRIIDLAEPNNPVQIGCSGLYDELYGCEDVAVNGDYAYLPAPCRLYVANVQNPSDLHLSVGWETEDYIHLTRITIADGYAYVNGTNRQRIHIFSLSDPLSPAWIDSVSIPGNWTDCGLAVSCGYLFAVGSHFSILSLLGPEAPQLIGTINGLTGVDLAVSGHYAFVASRTLGTRIVDVCNPAQPTLVGQIPGECHALAIQANTLITRDLEGLRAWDITDPLNPQPVGHYIVHAEIESLENIKDIDILNGYLYTISRTCRFRAYQCDALSAEPARQPVTPRSCWLYSCYPNPFNPTTTISFSLPRTSFTRLAVYDITGRQTGVLVSTVLNAGEHRISFDGSALPSGLYFARLEAGQEIQTRKMVLLK